MRGWLGMDDQARRIERGKLPLALANIIIAHQIENAISQGFQGFCDGKTNPPSPIILQRQRIDILNLRLPSPLSVHETANRRRVYYI